MPILPEFDAAAFVPGAPIDNPFFPLQPGQIRAYRAEMVDEETGEREVESHDAFVTYSTLDVQGVQAVVVRDTDYLNGFLVEDTLDYYAQDQAGNVWYLGEDVINYRYDDDGVFTGVDNAGSFRAGVEGAQGGWKMPAMPGFSNGYYQEFDPGNAIDEAIVVGAGEAVEIALGTFEGAVKILDTTALEPDAAEFKYYVAGLGEALVEEDLDEEGEPELVVELQELREVDVVDEEGEARESFLDFDADDADDEDEGDVDEDGEPEIGLGDLANRQAVDGLDDAEEPGLDDFLGSGDEILIHFLGEDAGFDSALGAYTVDLATGALGEGRILLSSTEEAEPGESVGFTVEDGQALGLFLVPNGAEGGVDLEAFEDGGLHFANILTRDTANIDDLLAPLVTDAAGTPLPVTALHVLGNADGFNFLNPSAGVNAIELESVLADGDGAGEITLVGFEDLLVTDARNDGDFNDVVVAVSHAPLDGATLAGLVAELAPEAAVA